MNTKKSIATGAVAGGLAVAMLLAMVPTVSAQATFGSVVGATDFDTMYIFDPAGTGALTGPGAYMFAFFDDDADGTVDTDDPVYLTSFAAPGVTPLDVRISVPGFTSGTQVRGTDGDNALAPTAGPLLLAFSDLDSSGGYTAGDELYLDVQGPGGDGAVSSGDVRLTDVGSRPAGSRVGATDADLGTPVLPLPIAPGCPLIAPCSDFFDINGDLTYNRGDVVYLDTDASGTSTVNDVRLMPFGGKAFGSVVAGTDFDTTYAFDPGATGTVNAFLYCFFDDDADGTVDTDDPMYLAAGCGGAPVAPLDVRVSVPGFTSGTQVRGTDGDNALAPLSGACALGFSDLDSSGGYTAGDEMYLDVQAPGCGGDGAVSAGDVRLTDVGSRPAGSRVGATDADLGTPLIATGLGPALADFFDLNGDLVYNRGDVVYFDVDASGSSTVNDIRSMPFGGQMFGSVVGPTDFDTSYFYDPAPTGTVSGAYTFAFFDDDADGTVDLDDPVYLAACAAGGGCSGAAADVVAPLDVRISVPGFTSGTQVRGTDGDNALAGLALAGALAFSDLDSSGGYTAGDELYVDVNADGAVSSGDVRVTDVGSRPAGSRVGATDADLGTPIIVLAAAGATIADFFDINGDLVYNRGDVVYLDTDVLLGIGGTVSVNDVRLMPFAGAPPPGGTTSPATTGPATTGPATTGPATTGPATTGPATTGPATTGPATTPPATTSSPSPGFEALAVLVGLGAAIAVVASRRKA